MDERTPVTDWTTDFDILDPGYTEDPGPIWRDIRERCPMAHTDRWGGAWMATRYEDVQSLIRKVPELSNRQPTILPIKEGKDLLADYNTDLLPPITKDPPDSIPLRRLLLPFFTPKAVETHRPFTEQLCHGLIDGFIAAGACDAAEDYARQISPRVIGHMLGIDPGQADEFVGWVQGFIEFGASDYQLRADNYRIIRDFFAEQVAGRRAQPGDDFISQLLTKDIAGEPVSDKVIINMCVLLLSAGIDTTWSTIGSSLLHFAANREDRRRLAAEPGLLAGAVEEMLRLHAPVSAGRIAMEDVQHGDATVKRGERLILNLPAANRDPAVFENPDDYIIDREKNRHVAFGIGFHRCAGSNLARLEMEVALGVWFSRIPEFELSDPAAVTWSAGQVRGARTVPVTF
ncbi:MAG: cytochrome P450 [Alphaproteobacteria bacterium]|jgi:cytochrome P450